MGIWPRITTRPLCLCGRTNQKLNRKVEGAFLLVERWILARLRNQQFFDPKDVNAAIRPLLDRLKDKDSRHPGASRRQLFEQLDRPALKLLPLLSNLRSGNSAASGSRILAFPFDAGLGFGGPFLVDLHQDGADQSQQGVVAWKDPDLCGAPLELLLNGSLHRV